MRWSGNLLFDGTNIHERILIFFLSGWTAYPSSAPQGLGSYLAMMCLSTWPVSYLLMLIRFRSKCTMNKTRWGWNWTHKSWGAKSRCRQNENPRYLFPEMIHRGRVQQGINLRLKQFRLQWNTCIWQKGVLGIPNLFWGKIALFTQRPSCFLPQNLFLHLTVSAL